MTRRARRNARSRRAGPPGLLTEAPRLVRAAAAGPRPRRLRLDLHLHTNRSDGRLDPEDLVARCALAGLDLVAVTDHDFPPPLAGGFWAVGARSVEIVEAVELSGAWEGRELHLLVYFPGAMPADYRDFLTERARGRARRYDEAVRAIGLEGLPGADAAAANGERALTRLHLARALVAVGHCSDVDAAMAGWTGAHTGLVPLIDLPWAEAIERSRAAGGICSWAHPDRALAEVWTGTFARLGLHAVEASRPSLGRLGRAGLVRLAHRHHLAVSGGSDFHGWGGGSPGSFVFPGWEGAELLRLLGR